MTTFGTSIFGRRGNAEQYLQLLNDAVELQADEVPLTV
jgi:hypothetical protein